MPVTGYIIKPQVDKEGARKELVLSERQAKLTQAVQKFKIGQTVKGQVIRLEDYGAIVNISVKGKPTGVQGLLHKSELSWDLVMHVDDLVQEGRRMWMLSWAVCRVGLFYWGLLMVGDGQLSILFVLVQFNSWIYWFIPFGGYQWSEMGSSAS